MADKRQGTVIKLSGTVADGGSTAITAYPTKTVVHTVPEGEMHQIFAWVSNNNSSLDLEILGDFGGDVDAFDKTALSEDVVPLVEGAVLVGGSGGTTFQIAAVSGATNLHFFGYAVRYGYTS